MATRLSSFLRSRRWSTVTVWQRPQRVIHSAASPCSPTEPRAELCKLYKAYQILIRSLSCREPWVSSHQGLNPSQPADHSPLSSRVLFSCWATQNRIDSPKTFKLSGVGLCDCVFFTVGGTLIITNKTSPRWTKISQGNMLQVSLQIWRHRPLTSQKCSGRAGVHRKVESVYGELSTPVAA